MKTQHNEDEDTLLTEQILSFHQEKRTSLRLIRIGLSMVAAQASLLGVMFATSAYDAYIRTRHWMVPFLVLNLLFFATGAGLIVQSMIHIHRLDHKIWLFKQK